MQHTELLTVFTPSHNPVFLTECFQSLQEQLFGDWEWVVVLNKRGSGSRPAPIRGSE